MPILSTGTQILDRAKYLVDDTVESPRALEIINSGLDDMSVEAPYIRVSDLVLPANTRSLTLPSDTMSVIEVRYEGKPLDEMDPGEYNEDSVGGEVKTYNVIEDRIDFAPLPTSNQNVRVVYQADYGQLDKIEDPITQLPRQFRMALVYWLAMHHRFNNEDRDWSIVMNSEFLRYRHALRSYQDNRGGYTMPRSG